MGAITRDMLINSNGFECDQLQLPSGVSSGILHGENNLSCDEQLVYCSQCSCNEFLCKHDKL